MKTLPEQDQLVADYLKQLSVSYSAHYCGKFNDDGWNADLWRVTFTAANGKQFSTDFKTGIGHRIELASFSGFSKHDKKFIAEVKAVTYLEKVTFETGATGKRFAMRAVVPTQANVLYCLLSDMQCVEYGYGDFCANLGYDEDSRKALETFLSCDKIGSELKQFFSRETIETLQTMLEDY